MINHVTKVRRPKLSILIPAIVERAHLLPALLEKIGKSGPNDPHLVEVISLMDAKDMTIGKKRQHLVDLARGNFITFVDDDDMVAPNYLRVLLAAIEKHPDADVINYLIKCQMFSKGVFIEGVVNSSIEFEIEQFAIGKITKRKPIQLSVWRRELALQATFPDANRNEDFGWAEQLWDKVEVEVNLPQVLYYYTRYRDLSESYS